MANLKFEVPHSLSREEAKKRVEALLEAWGRKYGMQTQWAGDSAQVAGKAMGIRIDARLEVGEKAVGGEGPDPGMLLRGQAQKYLTRKFADYLNPSKSLADLDHEE